MGIQHHDTHRPEGTVFFEARHTSGGLPRGAESIAPDLLGWRAVLFALGVIGQDPRRYDGAGYGNVSARLGPFPGRRGERAFLVTGTQTGGQPALTADALCWVKRYEIAHNRVWSQGPLKPSSESMTHGAVYDLGGHIRYVFHGHCPQIWHAAKPLKLPTTQAHIAYGTPQMAAEIRRLAAQAQLLDRRILTMAGHEDGVITFGRTAHEAGEIFVRTLAAAHALRP